MKDKEYLYTVIRRGKKLEAGGYDWEKLDIKATSMVEVSRVTGTPLDDLIYVSKVIVK